MHYAAGLWRLFGVNLFDQERLTYQQFLDMCQAVDHYQEAANSGS